MLDYNKSLAGKAAQAKYRASPKGQAALARAAAKYNTSPKRKLVNARRGARENGHNVMPEGRAWMLEQQGGACAISGCDRDATEVDHDHATYEVRGMLCIQCNLSLGGLGDNADGLRRALQYVSPFSL